MQVRWRQLRVSVLMFVLATVVGSERLAGAQDPTDANSAQDGSAQDGGRGRFPGGQMIRGIVTEVSAQALTVKSERGEIYKIVTTDNTRLMKDRQPVKMADIKPGDGVGAAGVMDAPNKTVHAAVVMVADAEQVKKAQADLGKTYIAGKVTAIDEVKLTVQRPDGVSQVIQVDEGTSFRRGRGRGVAGMGGAFGDTSTGAVGQPAGGGAAGAESITLADIKVGDGVAGKGALKNGVFVPTELAVMDPAASRGRRRGAAAGGDANGATPATGSPRP